MKTCIFLFVIALMLSSCNSRQVSHPAWQNNFYKYRNTNAPDIPAERFFRLNPSGNDSTILNLLAYPKTEIINVGNSRVKHLQTDITKLKELNALDIAWTDFTEFPKIIFDLPVLISLHYDA